MIGGFKLALAVIGVLLTLIGNATAVKTDEAALAAFAGLMVLSWPTLSKLARTLGILSALALATVFIVTAPSQIDVGSAVFVFAFLLTSGTLRIMAGEDLAVRRLGQAILGGRLGNRFVVTSLGTGLLAIALLNGAVQFVCGLFASRAHAPETQRLTTIRAILSGFVLNPMLSPIAIPFVVVSTTMPIIMWQDVAPFLIAAGAVVWISGALDFLRIERADRAAAKAVAADAPTDVERHDPTRSIGDILPGLALVIAPIALALCLHLLLSMRLNVAAFISIFAIALVWPLVRLRQPSLIMRGFFSAINEATIVGASILLGLALVPVIPEAWNTFAAQSLLSTGSLAPALVFLSFVLGGLVGLQPAICFLASFSIIQAYLNVDATLIAPIMAAVIIGWALNSITGPFGMPLTIVARAFDLQPFDLAFRKGWPFLLMCTLGIGVVVYAQSVLDVFAKL